MSKVEATIAAKPFLPNLIFKFSFYFPTDPLV